MPTQDDAIQVLEAIVELTDKGITYTRRIDGIIERLTPIAIEHDAVAAQFNVAPTLDGIIAISKIDQAIRRLMEEMGEAAPDLMNILAALNAEHVKALQLGQEFLKSNHPHTEPKSHEVP